MSDPKIERSLESLGKALDRLHEAVQVAQPSGLVIDGTTQVYGCKCFAIAIQHHTFMTKRWRCEYSREFSTINPYFETLIKNCNSNFQLIGKRRTRKK